MNLIDIEEKKYSWSYFSYKIKVFNEKLLLTILNLEKKLYLSHLKFR